MKLLIAVLFLASLAMAKLSRPNMTDAQKKVFMNFRQACMAAVGVDKVKWLDWIQDGRWRGDARSKYYWWCLNKKLGYQDEYGRLRKEILEDHIKQIWGERKALGIMENCLYQWSKPETTAYMYAKCLHIYFTEL